MRRLLSAVTAVVAGAAAMYYLDPAMGQRRRETTRGKVVAASRSQRVAGYARDLVTEGRSRLGASKQQPGSNEQLSERVRARLEQVVAYPQAIDVDAVGGRVRLTGHILASDLDLLMAEIHALPGVQNVDNTLLVHAEADNVPELQSRGGLRRALKRASDKPVWKLLAMAVPVVAVAVGVSVGKRRKARFGTLALVQKTGLEKVRAGFGKARLLALR